jgi:hypothetical protein
VFVRATLLVRVSRRYLWANRNRLQDPVIKDRVGFLYSYYRDECYFWEPIDLVILHHLSCLLHVLDLQERCVEAVGRPVANAMQTRLNTSS